MDEISQKLTNLIITLAYLGKDNIEDLQSLCEDFEEDWTKEELLKMLEELMKF